MSDPAMNFVNVSQLKAAHRLKTSSRSGFTLIELLMVIAVILVLSSITYGIARGVKNSQARAQAKAELAMLSTALEQYKSRHGDYPRINGDLSNEREDNGEELLLALSGWLKWSKSDGLIDGMVPRDSSEGQGKSFIDPSRLSLSKPYSVNGAPSDTSILDPWGNSYAYVYGRTSTGAGWDNFGYILYSVGADGEDRPVGENGILTQEIREDEMNRDNIYVGE